MAVIDNIEHNSVSQLGIGNAVWHIWVSQAMLGIGMIMIGNFYCVVFIVLNDSCYIAE
jgi:hypothetical protein